ncbi:unnamed protein product [Ixodes persulcatus]
MVPTFFEGVEWSREPCEYLGVPLQHHKNSKRYWTDCAVRLRNSTTKWARSELSVFARATVCNMFLVSKLCYVLQVLQCARVNIQAFHRIFSLFIWSSGSEPMRRDNLFRSVKLGGVGLTHLFISQIASRFLFLRDQEDPFLRTVLQCKLASFVPTFVVSSCCSESPRLVGFLKEVAESFSFFNARFSIDYLSSVSRKRLVRDLRDMLFPIPLYRSLFSDGPGQDCLQRVNKMTIAPRVKTFFFKLHTATLPVKPWLQDKGIFVPSTINCNLCKAPETIDHIFIDCWDAIFFWDVLKRTIKKELYMNPHTIRYLPLKKNETMPIDTFVVLGLYSLWRSRLSVRHADVTLLHTHIVFLECISTLKSVFEPLPEMPEWASVFDQLLAAKWL